MKKLEYSTKATIFLLLSVVAAVFYVSTDWWGLDLLWTVLWGVGVFNWGAQRGQQKERLKNFRKLAWRSGPTVVDSI